RYSLFFFFTIPPPPSSPLFPYTTLFRSLGFLISVTASMIDRFYPILATEYAGMTEAQAGVVYLASSVVSLVAGPFIGWVSDRFGDRKSTRLNSSHDQISYAVFCLKKKKN